ncbi:hypothetical protein ACF08B_38670 [Streptomyces sp. NPDC015139]|uniref:hypothetical protein n=1 Tax=Streptomyces sp. NPDC015139 TaxID=3364942 RepID=UPI00370035C3
MAVTRYDSAGQVTGTSAVFRSEGTVGTGGPTSPEPADLPSYTDLVLDWAGRTVTSQLQVNGVAQAAGRIDTAYDGEARLDWAVGGTGAGSSAARCCARREALV